MTTTGLVCLVTGGNRGIGLAVCRALGELGHTVLLSARNGDDARKHAAALEAEGLDVRPLTLDVSDPDGVMRAAEEVAHGCGHLDVLINNAAISYDTWQHAATADLGVVAGAVDTNLYGPWRVVRAFLPLMRAGLSRHPRIVNVSSGVASLSTLGDGPPAYTVSKVGLNALTRMLAAELRAEGILVNAVCPGWVATDMGGHGGRPVEEGAAGIVWAATLPDDGPTGGFYRDGVQLPW